MYQVSIYNKTMMRDEGPIYFTGESEDFKTLREARQAAAEWIKNQSNYKDLQVVSRIVGCL